MTRRIALRMPLRRILAASVLALIAGALAIQVQAPPVTSPSNAVSSSPTAPSIPPQARIPASDAPGGELGVLTLNVGGIEAKRGVPWETRAQRIAAWSNRNGIAPDIIALQEVHGWLWPFGFANCGRGFGVQAGDYDQIDILLKALRDGTGVTYRVAYLTGNEASFSFAGTCITYRSQAVLYHPGRLANLTARAGDGRPHNDIDGLDGVPHLRRSLPLCSRRTNLMPLETLLDGASQTDKCGRPTPSGPAWAVLRAGTVKATFVRLALTTDPSRSIDVFNAHPGLEHEDLDGLAIKRLIDKVERPYSSSSLYYPPLLVGDLNDLNIGRDFPAFVTAHAPPQNDVEVIGIGNEESFPAQYRARVAKRAVLPDLPPGVLCRRESVDLLVSDHCGVFARFEWDGPDAGVLRGVFVDGPTRVPANSKYRLVAVPSGGNPLMSVRWQPGDATSPQLNARAGDSNTIQTWTVSVTDPFIARTVSKSISVIAESTCQPSCKASQASCLSCRGSSCPLPRECAAEYLRCVAGCRSSARNIRSANATCSIGGRLYPA
ncbi:hypothetical protein [Actinoplanes aureus]|uniref:Endonuclease/exonuclease/phosphatase domain-containing protein n=1 Tax=Actinoplanes aureus TaxID=2792083 RepID=A0A931CK40_9ACTN|nr:hypothetical protein [Actinoplanes aureus]MBG0568808.1 hypothetical protein [Actinoplanes aureus]